MRDTPVNLTAQNIRVNRWSTQVSDFKAPFYSVTVYKDSTFCHSVSFFFENRLERDGCNSFSGEFKFTG